MTESQLKKMGFEKKGLDGRGLRYFSKKICEDLFFIYDPERESFFLENRSGTIKLTEKQFLKLYKKLK
jgi:uncharacterized protein (DUF2344 family)